MTLPEVKDWAAVVGTIIALATLAKATFEYSLQSVQKRAEIFLEMRRRFNENETFRMLCSLIEDDDIQLRGVPFKDKREFLGFIEEIALMTNTGLIRGDIAHYMFGYYAIKCWASDNFWHGLNRKSQYWQLFRDFVKRMELRDASFSTRRRDLRF